MKRIAIVIGDIKYGGAERVSVYLANYFNRKGIEVSLISYHSNSSNYKLDNIRHLSLNRDTRYKNSITRFISLVRDLRNCLLQEKPDIVLGMMSYNGVAASLALLGTKIPVVTSERNDPSSTTARTSFEKAFIKFTFNFLTKGLVFQTKEAQKYYSKRVQKKSVIIPNPIFGSELIDVKRPVEPTKRIISVGRLVDQKNFKMLILAFKEFLYMYPDYFLDIFGEGEKRKELEELISANELSGKVNLRGNTNKIFEELQKSDLFVLSSNYEGMPNALIEAMAMGLPVISTDCNGGGARFLIEDGINGLLIPAGDQASLVHAMRKIVDDRDFSERLGRNALNIRERLDGTTICQEWERNLFMWSGN